MSVIGYTNEEFQGFFNRLVYEAKSNAVDRIRVIPREDLEEYKKLVMSLHKKQEYEAKEEAINVKIFSFVDRVAMANRLCFFMQYKDIDTIDRLELNDPTLEMMSDKKLFKFIQSVKYNCVTNAGYTTLPGDVETTLNNVLITLGGKLYQED